MLSRPQIIHLKRAQHEAGIADAEYRDTLEQLCAVRSSTDPNLTEGQMDMLMKFFEAIYWRQVDEGKITPPPGGKSVFKARNYWLHKNPPGNSSRHQYARRALEEEIHELEMQLAADGCGESYFAAIKRKTGKFMVHYRAALQRTLAARRKNADVPLERRPF